MRRRTSLWPVVTKAGGSRERLFLEYGQQQSNTGRKPSAQPRRSEFKRTRRQHQMSDEGGGKFFDVAIRRRRSCSALGDKKQHRFYLESEELPRIQVQLEADREPTKTRGKTLHRTGAHWVRAAPGLKRSMNPIWAQVGQMQRRQGVGASMVRIPGAGLREKWAAQSGKQRKDNG